MKRIWLIFLVFSVLLSVSCSTNKKYPDPTNKFYVNDYANALMTYTENEIVSYNRYLYEVYGEIQIVYATFLIDDYALNEIDKTELYRQWGIGKDDKGILIILYFEPTMIDDISTLSLSGYAYELGYNLESLFTVSIITPMLEDTLLNDAHADITDLMVMHLNFELLNHIYVTYYDETPILYDMDDYFDELMNAPYIPDDTSQNFWPAIQIFDGSLTSMIIIVFVILIGGSFGVMRIKGGGGSSGGAGLFRKRK